MGSDAVVTTFDHRLAYGKIGESMIANWIKSRGYHVLPVYEKEISEGKGPQLFCADGCNLIAPDMLAVGTEKVIWVEAKHKSVFSWHRITQRWVTGIDLRHYEDYQRVAARSPWPVWLLFLHSNGHTEEYPHKCPIGLFGGELSVLQRNESHRSDRWGKPGMVYWAHETLKRLATIEQVSGVPVYTTGDMPGSGGREGNSQL